MKHYLYREALSGEEFIIGAARATEAVMLAEGIAQDIGEEYNGGDWYLRYLGELSDEEAEASGLDEY